MSDVEKYWDAIRAKWPTPQPEWKDLPPQKKDMIINSINTMLFVLSTP